jgi:hypothetical protein
MNPIHYLRIGMYNQRKEVFRKRGKKKEKRTTVVLYFFNIYIYGINEKFVRVVGLNYKLFPKK